MQIPKRVLFIAAVAVGLSLLCVQARDNEVQAKAREALRQKLGQSQAQQPSSAPVRSTPAVVVPAPATPPQKVPVVTVPTPAPAATSPGVDAAAIERARRQLEQKAAELEGKRGAVPAQKAGVTTPTAATPSPSELRAAEKAAAKARAAEERRLKAEAEAARKKTEAEAEKQRRAVADAARKAEEQRRAEEKARAKAEAEAEKQRLAAAQAAHKAEVERLAAEKARAKAEAELAQKQARQQEEELKRASKKTPAFLPLPGESHNAKVEAAAQARAAEDQRAKAEAEKMRKKAEAQAEKQRRAAAEAEKSRQKAEAEAARRAEDHRLAIEKARALREADEARMKAKLEQERETAAKKAPVFMPLSGQGGQATTGVVAPPPALAAPAPLPRVVSKQASSKYVFQPVPPRSTDMGSPSITPSLQTPPPSPEPVLPAETRIIQPTPRVSDSAKDKAAGRKTTPKTAEKPTSVIGPPTYTPMQPPASPVPADKASRLAELLRKYKADEITPDEYHQQRAKILAEP